MLLPNLEHDASRKRNKWKAFIVSASPIQFFSRIPRFELQAPVIAVFEISMSEDRVGRGRRFVNSAATTRNPDIDEVSDVTCKEKVCQPNKKDYIFPPYASLLPN